MSKSKKKSNTAVRLVTFILVLLLIIGVAGAIVNLLFSSMGMYVEYGGNIITSDNDGITIDCSEGETATFTIKKSDWGVYNVEDCEVTIINNVNSSSAYDFEYYWTNELCLFSYTTDFTSVFSEDGGEIGVNSDGEFTLYCRYTNMLRLLNAYYDGGVSGFTVNDYSLSGYPYFAIQIISPDKSSAIVIPFVIQFGSVSAITVTPESIIF